MKLSFFSRLRSNQNCGYETAGEKFGYETTENTDTCSIDPPGVKTGPALGSHVRT